MGGGTPAAGEEPYSGRNSRRRAYAVWEITLRCNLACVHCGSRAGPSRPDELSTEEALDLVAQLADVGITEVTLLGGEAFLRRDWLTIAEAITAAGMECTLTTGGWGVTAEMARRMRAAGIARVSVSIDGLEATHDALRGRPGSWRRCFTTLERLADAGIMPGCNTQINRLTAPELPSLYEAVRDAGAKAWQVQFTGPMGHAADRPEILLQPPELLDVFPLLARIARRAWREDVAFLPAQNVGYYGPYERLLRSNGHPFGFWQGPFDGLSEIGIESDGSVKADPTLPSAPYIGGNVRERPLRAILEEAPQLRFNLGAGSPEGVEHLWGFCRTCEFATLCRGGDTFTAHVFFDRRGNHPYCHHRALVHRANGLRERLTPEKAASGDPYDNGVFSIVEEPFDDPWPEDPGARFTADSVRWPPGWPPDDEADRARSGPTPAIVDASPALADGAVLPRSAWTSQFARFREVVRAKKALDRAEAAEPQPGGVASEPAIGAPTPAVNP